MSEFTPIITVVIFFSVFIGVAVVLPLACFGIFYCIVRQLRHPPNPAPAVPLYGQQAYAPQPTERPPYSEPQMGYGSNPGAYPQAPMPPQTPYNQNFPCPPNYPGKP
ncbi:hypothetical protein RF11_04348 [Thelohanellus kitauei]|uniref:Uncharacterized protein n=1 Tax=Thelohanellus kitauei TaxID=669202 RepID=A0A0C2JSZ6_THEKT|nr:hypothetical protein RF11_04348 [Thelohanellus kitauei]